MLLYLFAININGLDLKVHADCAKKKMNVSTECTLTSVKSEEGGYHMFSFLCSAYAG